MSSTAPRPQTSPSGVVSVVGFATLYFLLSAVALVLTRFDGGVPFIWVAAALLIAHLVALRFSRWPPVLIACAVASLAATCLFGLGPAAAPAIMFANLMEATTAALLIRRFVGRHSYLDSTSGIGHFIFAVGVVAPFLSGLIGTATATLVTDLPFRTNLLHWFAGHGLGALTFTPLISMALAGDIVGRIRKLGRRKIAETAGLLALVAGTAAAVFGQQDRPILFLPLLPMMAATIRGGRAGAAGSTLLLAVIGGVLTLNGHGPIQLLRTDVGGRILFFEGYLACAALLVLPVAALLCERGTLLRELGDSEAKYRMLMAHSPDAILEVGADGTIRYASPAAAAVTGRDAAALVGTAFRSLIAAEDIGRLDEIRRIASERRVLDLTFDFRTAAGLGETRWLEAKVCTISTTGQIGAGVVISLRDISNHKASERALAEEAATDPLTGLPNRRAFMAVLDRRFGELVVDGVPASVAMLDLDHFKSINDRYGHAVGDAVLHAVAIAARRALRDSDCIGRLGGEEFGILFWGADPRAAIAAGERIAEAIRTLRIPLPSGETLHITASIGVAHLRSDGSPATALATADTALYRAKHAGRDRLLAA